MLSIGVDVGGTFTDIVLSDDSRRETRVLKVPTTAGDPAIAVVEALARLGAKGQDVDLISHASTIATNALLTRDGLAATALVTTRGFRDVVEIGRQRRPELYNLYTRRPVPLVRRRDRFVVSERTSADGTELRPLSAREAMRVARRIAKGGYQAVAVAFLNSYASPSHETTMAECLSLAGFSAVVRRARSVRVEFFDEHSELCSVEATGWYARILQHEIDHLSGTLYIDHMRRSTFTSLENYSRFWKAKPDPAR